MGFPVPNQYKWNDDASTTVVYNNGDELDGMPNPDLIEGGGSEPTGTKEITITENGTTTEDVAEYASAEITVDVPSGSSTLTTKTITENGTYNASSDEADGYSSVTVNVPQPSGTKQISITQNGTTTENVADYASAEITVNVPSSGYKTGTITPAANTAEITIATGLSVIHGMEIYCYPLPGTSPGVRYQSGLMLDITNGRYVTNASNNAGTSAYVTGASHDFGTGTGIDFTDTNGTAYIKIKSTGTNGYGYFITNSYTWIAW